MEATTVKAPNLALLAIVALGIALMGAGCSDNEPPPSGTTLADATPITPAPGNIVYDNHGVRFEFPDNWRLGAETTQDDRVLIHVESPAGSNLYIEAGGGSSEVEVVEAAEQDEAAIALIVDQVVPQPPQLEEGN